jgi:hypothetical protein
MAFLPLVLGVVSAAGAAYQAVSARNAASYNAKTMQNEQTLSVNQGAAGAAQVQRASRESLGRQAAAFGGAGVGYGGSSETALDQSAVNQEMDALNTKYKGSLAGYGYGVQSSLDKGQAGAYGTQAGLLAGSALLKGMGANYSFAPNAASQSGMLPPGVTPGYS